MELKKTEVIAVITEKDELVCNKCATDKDWTSVVDTSKLFMADSLKDTDSLFFCDKCNTRLKA